MSNIWQTVMAILGSIGGAGVIIIGVSSWLGKLWAERLMRKNEFEYLRCLELIKQDFERKNYIHQTRFLKEFEIYGALTESCYNMITDSYSLFPKHLSDITDLKSPDDSKKKIVSEKFIKANTACDSFVSALYFRAAFIPENIFENLIQLKNSASRQCDFFQELAIAEWNIVDSEKIKEKYELAWKNSFKLAIDYENFLKELRAYISSLDM